MRRRKDPSVSQLLSSVPHLRTIHGKYAIDERTLPPGSPFLVMRPIAYTPLVKARLNLWVLPARALRIRRPTRRRRFDSRSYVPPCASLFRAHCPQLRERDCRLLRSFILVPQKGKGLRTKNSVIGASLGAISQPFPLGATPPRPNCCSVTVGRAARNTRYERRFNQWGVVR